MLKIMKRKVLGGILFLIFVFVLAGCSLFSKSPEPLRSPEDIVGEFYERYFGCLYDEYVEMIDSCMEVHIKRPYLTEENRERVIEISQDSPDFDPLFCAYNLPQEDFDIGEAVIEGEEAQLSVTFHYPQESHAVSLKLHIEDGMWKIDSFDCE